MILKAAGTPMQRHARVRHPPYRYTVSAERYTTPVNLEEPDIVSITCLVPTISTAVLARHHHFNATVCGGSMRNGVM